MTAGPQMPSKSLVSAKTLVLILSLTIVLSACQTKEIEVTRIEIKDRRVIERVVVTVEVTRIQQVTVTPRPATPTSRTSNRTPSPTPPTTTATPLQPPRPAATEPPSAKVTGERLLAAAQEMEQTLLSLVQALNSDPLAEAYVLELYAAIGAAPTFDIAQDQAELESIYARYREQVDYVMGEATDLRNHLAQIESGEANVVQISSIHLSLARNAASAGTSNIQALLRELEAFLASQP